MQFCPDRDYVFTRWRANPSGALVAELDGRLAGSVFATRWGSVGFLGPLTIHPEAWDRGIARHLLEATMERFDQWQTGYLGLFTFSNSPKHLHLYQKFGFWPRFLTSVMSLALRPRPEPPSAETFSRLAADQQEEFLNAAHGLTDSIHEGLDLHLEIRAVEDLSLGDTVMMWDDSRLAAFAVCHCGAGTEAGEGTCYVKFAAARTGEAFEDLLNACEAFAAGRGLTRLEAGVNMARLNAYQRMMARGFRSDMIGVAMHKSNEPGYNHPGTYVIDDWR
jgi:GNAT superfamily N-acetyltransferase